MAQATGAPKRKGILPVPLYGGRLDQRLRLTGDWGGARTNLAEHGVQVNVDWYQIYFGGVSGGVEPLDILPFDRARFALRALTGGLSASEILRSLRNEEEDIEPNQEYTGALDYTVLFDSGAMGLWQGGLLVLHGETLYGGYANTDTGALIPLQIRTAIPETAYPITTLSHVIYTQYFSQKVNLQIGKLPTFGTMKLPFASGPGISDFGNYALQDNPMTSLMIPYTGWGALLTVAPNPKLELQLTAVDTEGDATRVGLDTVFEGKTTFAGSLRLRSSFFDKPGEHVFAGVYGSGSYFKTNEILEINWGGVATGLIAATPEGYGPQIIGVRKSSGTWIASYAGMQYVDYDAESKRGTAIFTRVALADRDTNPIEGFVSFGLWGRGPFASRPRDEWGLGYFYADVNDGIPERVLVGDGFGVEAFYKFMLTPSIDLTPSIQVVDPPRKNADTLWALGARMNIRF